MNHGFLDSNMWLFGLLFWLGHKRDLITEYPVLYNSEYSGTHRCFILQVLFSFDKRRDFLSIEVLDTFYNIKHNRKSWFFFFLLMRLLLHFTRLGKHLFSTPPFHPSLSQMAPYKPSQFRKMCTYSTVIIFD